jgi:hypothetical protein
MTQGTRTHNRPSQTTESDRIHARALARAHREDQEAMEKARQEARSAGRTGPSMCRYILAALADAGQDVTAGRYLREKVYEVTDRAIAEWLAATMEVTP